MDCKELVAGSTLFLPVWVPGANFSAGDGHGRQGDGEVCVNALEMGLTGTFTFVLHKAADVGVRTWPSAESPTHHLTLGFNEDLDSGDEAGPAGDDRPDRVALVAEPGAGLPVLFAGGGLPR